MADTPSHGPLQPDSRDEAQLELRASDADRDRTAAVLSNALAEGRLTTTEHAQRLDAAYAATTVGQLAPLTRDLPADHATDAGIASVDRAEVAARFSKVIRTGRWVAGRRTLLTARFGALIVNLADAVLPGREITLDINTFCGKLVVIVPAEARVIDQGGALFAKRAIYGHENQSNADGPVIRLVGDARFSKVAVYRGHYDPHEAQVPPWLRQLAAGSSGDGHDGPKKSQSLPEARTSNQPGPTDTSASTVQLASPKLPVRYQDTLDPLADASHLVQQLGTATYARYSCPGQASAHALGCIV